MRRIWMAAPIGMLLSCSAQSHNTTLDVRHITLGMTPAQVDTLAKAAGMRQVHAGFSNSVRYLDSTASGKPVGGNSSSGGHGLILDVSFDDGIADRIQAREQGDMDGREVTKDFIAKWGQPTDGTLWGDPNKVYATAPNNLCMGDCPVTIMGPKKPARNTRQGVPM